MFHKTTGYIYKTNSSVAQINTSANVAHHCWITNFSVSQISTCLANVSQNYWITNYNFAQLNNGLAQSVLQNYEVYTNLSVAQINTCVANFSPNYWIKNSSVAQLNAFLANVSQNYWVTKNNITHEFMLTHVLALVLWIVMSQTLHLSHSILQLYKW